MPTLLDLPLYLAYSLAGTTSAGLAKASIHQAMERHWGAAALRFGGAMAALCANLGLLVFLLARADMSVMVPVAVGFNLLLASIISLVGFRERIDVWKALGMMLILLGVALLSVGA